MANRRFLPRILTPLLSIAAIVWALVVALDPYLTISSPPRLQILNPLPLIAIALLLWVATKKFTFSLLVTCAITALLFYANASKLRILDESLITADLFLIPQVIFSYGLFADFLAVPTIVWIGVVASIALLALLALLEKPIFKLAVLSRLVIGIPVLVLLWGLLQYGSKYQQWYEVPEDQWKPWDPRANAQNFGLVFSMVRDASALTVAPPSPDRPRAEAWLAAHSQQLNALTVGRGGSPDIIVFLSEAFYDPGILKGVEPCDYIPHFCELAKRGTSGHLTTPANGGNTLRTEFEVLTGIGLEQFPAHKLPYFSLVTKKTPSLPWELAEIGYKTVAMHPYKRSFWNRNVAFPFLGFQEFLSEESFDNAVHSGYYIADVELNTKIVASLASGTPKFILATSMENHGPWGKRPNIDEQRVQSIAVPANLPAEFHREWREYIYHLQNADRALRELANEVLARKRYTVLLFFGDHLPAQSKIFAAMGYDTPNTTYGESTKYLIIDNKSPEPQVIDTDAEFLPGLLLDRAGFAPGKFFAANAIIAKEFAKAPPGSAEQQRALAEMRNLQLLRFKQTGKL